MWLIKISGITKDNFYEVCHMSAECKNVNGVLHAQYHLKQYLLDDVKDLQKKYKFTFEIINLGRTPKTPMWFY